MREAHLLPPGNSVWLVLAMSLRDIFADQSPGYCLPPTIGANKQILTVPSSPSAPRQLVWSAPSAGGQTLVRSGVITFLPAPPSVGEWTLNYNLYTSGQVVTLVGQSASGTITCTGTGGAATSLGTPFIDYEPMLGGNAVGVIICLASSEDETVTPQISAAVAITSEGIVNIIPYSTSSAITITLEPMAIVWSYLPPG